ncbi:MAG TPA: hypothetical protein VM284_05255 [Candidatus Limnocylindria bacterium]|nr:hypothetical protein [Candidatus Limnocylindria bacterium]
MTIPELLQHWRDAIRAAEEAERMATLAADAASRADVQADEAAELATLAAEAAAAAARASERASKVAGQAAAAAAELRDGKLSAAQGSASERRKAEIEAASAYHSAEDQVRDRG